MPVAYVPLSMSKKSIIGVIPWDTFICCEWSGQRKSRGAVEEGLGCHDLLRGDVQM